MLMGEKIILRPLKMADLEKTHEWRNNIELIKLTQGIRFPKTLEMDKAWFDNALNDKSNRNIYFGIDEIETNAFVGIFQLNSIDYISGTAIWGFIIGDKDKQNKGYGFEASKLLFNYAFNVLNLRKIFSYLSAFNQYSIGMHEKIGGFIEEGRLRKHVYFDGEYHDVIILSLFRENFIGR